MRRQAEKLGSILRKYYMNLKISIKIMLVYLIFMIFSVTLSSYIYQKIYYDIISKKVGELSLQTLYSIKSNINSLIEDVNRSSRIILSNESVQNIIKNSGSENYIRSQIEIRRYLSSIIECMPNIASIFVFDNFGNKYSVSSQPIKSFEFNRVEEASWYKDAIDKNGYFILRLNCGEVKKIDSDKNFVSFIRIINDMNSQKPIGILIINISESNFVNCYKDIISKYGTNILLLNEDNKKIVSQNSVFGSNIKDDDIIPLGAKKYDSITKRINGQDYILSSLKVNEYNWKIVSSVPFRDISKESSQFSFVAFIVIVINGLLLFIGSIFISNIITNPIKKLLKSMKGFEKGEFKRVNIQTGNDEIGKLKDGYNIMIEEIEKLINRIIDEQKIKRKAELNVLQAQIKPHFLYNTLDAMCYLALSGKCNEVYEALETLGNYYRTSLSKGSEVITIGEEIEIVKNYLSLQKLRYGNVFTDLYEVDERVYDYKILKLILQPLVENSLYHGIKPKGEGGYIKIKVKQTDCSIKLSIEDDGVGMTREELTKVISTKIDTNCTSFGLRGTIERLRIFYGVSDVYEIESHKNKGTKITIIIPIYKEKGI